MLIAGYLSGSVDTPADARERRSAQILEGAVCEPPKDVEDTGKRRIRGARDHAVCVDRGRVAHSMAWSDENLHWLARLGEKAHRGGTERGVDDGTDHVARIVDAVGLTDGAAQRAEIFEPALRRVSECVILAGRQLGVACNIATSIDARADRQGATERSQIFSDVELRDIAAHVDERGRQHDDGRPDDGGYGSHDGTSGSRANEVQPPCPAGAGQSSRWRR